MSDNDTVVVQSESTAYRWGISREHLRDCYVLYCHRYETDINGKVQAFNLTNDGQWVPYEENQIIEPTLRLSGNLIHVMRVGASFREDDFETLIFKKFTEWLNLFSKAQEEGLSV